MQLAPLPKARGIPNRNCLDLVLQVQLASSCWSLSHRGKVALLKAMTFRVSFRGSSLEMTRQGYRSKVRSADQPSSNAQPVPPLMEGIFDPFAQVLMATPH